MAYQRSNVHISLAVVVVGWTMGWANFKLYDRTYFTIVHLYKRCGPEIVLAAQNNARGAH